MSADTVRATATIAASAEVIFGLLAEPVTHAAIDGTGWVREPLDLGALLEPGQVFRMQMHHAMHPDGDYLVFNEVHTFDRPSAISWRPGSDSGDGSLAFGGWVWRYDLRSIDAGTTEVTLTYDWSAVSDEIRQVVPFPPFPADHLSNSLAHLAVLAEPVTYEHCSHIEGPFFHGTKAALDVGDELVAGYGSNYQDGRISNNIYFSSLVGTAAWGAEMATALAGIEGRGHIYIVEPLGPFEDDPNVTNKKFPGNRTNSYRSRHPLRVVGEVDEWEGHPPEVLQGMLANLARLREQGLDLIED
jgi:rifampin ADP-ribosylating transferase